MPADLPVAGPRVLPALLGPRRLSAFRARRLRLSLVAGATGAPDRALSRPVDPATGRSRRGDVVLDDDAWLHVHEMEVDGRRVRGLVGLVPLDGEQVRGTDRHQATLLPHEGVDPDRVQRLADRMAALALDPAPLLLVRRGPATEPTDRGLPALLDRATSHEPDHDGRDARGGRHRLWTIRDTALAADLVACVARGRLLVADGHHRLAAHLDLATRTPAVGDGHALALVCAEDLLAPALAPIHRSLAGLDRATVVAALEADGHQLVPSATTAIAPPRDLAVDQLLVLDRTGASRLQVRAGSRNVVEALHAALDPVVGDLGWEHHHDAAAAEARLTQTDGVVVLLPPPSVAEAWDAAEHGRLLPAKATSFQPKPPLGVLLRSWRDV